MEKMMNSQSAAAVNSAKTSFMLSASTMFPFFGFNKMEITEGLNKIDIVNFIERAIRECKTKAQFVLEFGDERYCIFLNKDDKGYYITVDETSSKTVQRPVKEIKRHYFFCYRLTINNIDSITDYIYGIVADYYYGYGIYEAPSLEEAPALEEAPSLDEAPELEEDTVVEQIRKKYSYTDASGMDVLDLVSYFNDLEDEGADSAEEEAPSLEEAPALEEAPVLDEKKILEDFCTNEASKIMADGLTIVALSEEEHYLYDYEALYDYLVDAGFNEDRAYEIRDQYDEEVDRAIRGLLTDSTFVPVEVSVSDVESTERFWDNITMPYSARGLAYAKEHTNGVSMADIIRKVAEEHWNFESVVKESQWTRFTNDSFRDLIWSTCWAEYLVGHIDEALEAETRYIMDFDSVYDDLFDELWPYMSTYDDSCGGCELWVNAWGVVERAAEIIEESGARCIDWDRFPDYVMDAFLGDLYGFDTFTERVMSELEGGDIIGIMPYDDGLHLSFVDDEAEVAA